MIKVVGSYGSGIDVRIHGKSRENHAVTFLGALSHCHFHPHWVTTMDSVRLAGVEHVHASKQY